MGILKRNIDSNPYTGIRQVEGYLKIKDKGSWLDKFFNNTPNYEQVKNIMQGKIYKVVSIEGLGDVEVVSIIDDIGNVQTLSDFFFEEV